MTAPERREHDVTIYAKGCETTRECYCLATNGRNHHEDDSPWIVNRQGHHERSRTVEAPPDPPFRPDEDLNEYRERVARAEAWDEGREAAVNDYGHDPAPGRTPNPYRSQA